MDYKEMLNKDLKAILFTQDGHGPGVKEEAYEELEKRLLELTEWC